MKLNRKDKIGAFCLLGMVMLATMFLAASNAQPLSTTGPDLNVTTRTNKQIIGALEGAPHNVEFEARMHTPFEVVLKVRIGDVVLDATARLGEGGEKKSAIIDGHGKALSVEEKETLITLARLLEGHIDPYRQKVPPHEDLLVRTVSYWASAPVGYPLTRQEI